jgi:hypothetical protein
MKSSVSPLTVVLAALLAGPAFAGAHFASKPGA